MCFCRVGAQDGFGQTVAGSLSAKHVLSYPHPFQGQGNVVTQLLRMTRSGCDMATISRPQV